MKILQRGAGRWKLAAVRALLLLLRRLSLLTRPLLRNLPKYILIQLYLPNLKPLLLGLVGLAYRLQAVVDWLNNRHTLLPKSQILAPIDTHKLGIIHHRTALVQVR